MGNGFFIAPLGWRNPCRTEFTNGKILMDCVMVLMLQYRKLSQLMHRFYLIIRILNRRASWFRMNKRYDGNQTQTIRSKNACRLLLIQWDKNLACDGKLETIYKSLRLVSQMNGSETFQFFNSQPTMNVSNHVERTRSLKHSKYKQQ